MHSLSNSLLLMISATLPCLCLLGFYHVFIKVYEEQLQVVPQISTRVLYKGIFFFPKVLQCCKHCSIGLLNHSNIKFDFLTKLNNSCISSWAQNPICLVWLILLSKFYLAFVHIEILLSSYYSLGHSYKNFLKFISIDLSDCYLLNKVFPSFQIIK